MKKITLFFALSLVSLIGYSQESTETAELPSESLERQTEYIIVLDDVTVGDNIDTLLNARVITGDLPLNFNNHELVHDEPDTSDIESKFIEGAFTYNEYALNYTGDSIDGYSKS
jgi:formylmethanofuran dehydrogenase subunit A